MHTCAPLCTVSATCPLQVSVGTCLLACCSVEYSTSILAEVVNNPQPESEGTAGTTQRSTAILDSYRSLCSRRLGCLDFLDSTAYDSGRIFYVHAMRRIHRAIYADESARAE